MGEERSCVETELRLLFVEAVKVYKRVLAIDRPLEDKEVKRYEIGLKAAGEVLRLVSEIYRRKEKVEDAKGERADNKRVWEVSQWVERIRRVREGGAVGVVGGDTREGGE